jgi:hypothetical protein
MAISSSFAVTILNDNHSLSRVTQRHNCTFGLRQSVKKGDCRCQQPKTDPLNHIFAALCGYVHLQRMQFTEIIRNAYHWQKALYQDVVPAFVTSFMVGKEYLNPQFQASVNA